MKSLLMAWYHGSQGISTGIVQAPTEKDYAQELFSTKGYDFHCPLDVAVIVNV